MNRRRILATLTGGFAAEFVNKLAPLLILRFVVAKIGVEAFGYAQFSYNNILDFAIPLVVAGYPQVATVEIGKNRENPARLGQVISEVAILRVLHALVIGAVLFGVLWFSPEYNKYLTLTMALSFLLITSALDMSFVHIGTSNVLALNVITISAKILSLGMILMLVREPSDLLLYALLYFGINGLISLSTFIYNARRFPLSWPSKDALMRRFRASQPFALIVFLLIGLERFDMFFVERAFGPTGAGLYGGAARYAQGLASVALTIGTVFYAEIVGTRDKESLTSHVSLGVWTIFALLAPIAVGAWVVGGDLLGLLLGPDYVAMGPVFATLTAAVVGGVLINVFGLQVLMFHGRSLAINGALLAGIAVGCALCFLLRDSMGMQGFAFAAVGGRIIAGAILMGLAAPYLSRLPLRETLAVAIPAIVMGIALKFIQANGLVPNILIGALIYAALLAAGNWSKVTRLKSLRRNH